MTQTIEIIGLGAGDLAQLPLGIYRKLTEARKPLYVRTAEHPVLQELAKEGLSFTSFDAIYEAEANFQTVYVKIVEQLLAKAKETDIIYAVPGHPLVAEQTVKMLLEQQEVPVTISGGQSYLDALFTALKIDPIEGFQFLDATSFRREEISYLNHLVFCQVYDRMIASEVKLTLLEDLPPDYEIVVATAVGTTAEQIEHIPLVELDRITSVSNLTSVYVPPAPEKLLEHQFFVLRNVIRTLRSPEGCQWDRQQTHHSLRKYAIEEVYELIAAIESEDDEAIMEELGDVLLQVMLHSQIGEDEGYFTVDDVIRRLVQKMIHRHPHVFQKEMPAKSWEELKREERDEAEAFLLEHVNMAGPALQVAEKLQKKAAQVGFDWPDVALVWDKLREEEAEFHEAAQSGNQAQMEDEFGDILFVLANIARFYQIDPELALRKANQKFVTRFTAMEKLARERKLAFTQMTLPELDQLWDEVKQKEE